MERHGKGDKRAKRMRPVTLGFLLRQGGEEKKKLIISVRNKPNMLFLSGQAKFYHPPVQ